MKDRVVAFLYILLLYVSLPFVPGIWRRFAQAAGGLAGYFGYIVLLAFGIIIILFLIIKQKSRQSFFWLAILGVIYYTNMRNLEFPIEKLHFIEYSLLSVLLFRALSHNLKGRILYLWTALISFCLGWLDEGIQYILPNRVYEIKDVAANIVASILGLLLIGCVLNPKAQEKPCPK
ncbi:VanZ family protein [Candidatus Omnitrophota bacterium]